MSNLTPLLEGVHAAPADRPSVVTVVAAHGDLQRRGGGWAGPCPVCGGDDRFHIKDRGDGTALIGCRGCIDNEPPEVRRKAFGEVMRVLFPERPAPARSRRNGVATKVSSEQPKSAASLATVLGGMGYSYRYNVRSARAELHDETGGWREANDRLIAHIRAAIPAEYTEAGKDRPLSFGRMAFEDCFLALLHHGEVDPFAEWLEALPTWHEEKRLDKWVSHVFTVADEQAELASWPGRMLLLGAVWRAFRPGTKIDEMPVFIGPQGCGKSTALRWLLPDDMPEWFGDGLRLAADDKVRAEALQGRVIVEAAEMSGSTRAERESLKAFLSRTDDGSVRLAYRRNPETALRRCVIAGTSNDPHCLPDDPTGNRRFVAITVRAGLDGAAGVRMYLKNFREQLWAEALHRYRDGETAHLPAELADKQRAANSGAVQVDETIEAALLEFLSDWGAKPFQQSDVRSAISGRLGGDCPSHRRLAVELQRVWCEFMGQQRIGGVKGRWRAAPV